MKRYVSSKIRLMLVGFVVSIILCGGQSAKADFTFGEPTNLGPIVNSSALDSQPNISPDGLRLYLQSNQPGGQGGNDVWVTTRATEDDPWGSPVNLGPTVNSSGGDGNPCISADGLTLYFQANRPEGYGRSDIWVTTRSTKDNLWGPPVNLDPPLNTADRDAGPSIPLDGLSLYFNSDRPGGFGRSASSDLWVSTRATTDDAWGEPVNLGPTVNSPDNDFHLGVSPDGMALFFTSSRPGGSGPYDIWVSTWSMIDTTWDLPVNLGPIVNSPADDRQPSISTDGSTLYFSSDRSGGEGDFDIWQAPIIPIVDLNGDGIVDSADMCIIVDHWGEDYSLCDIGPMPWGDGIVDVQDLIVLAEHLFEDYRVIAHWKLDETEGIVAADSVGDNDGFVIGDPVWQPASGKIDGALQFDGIDDCISTEFVLNPALEPFSVFAWIKGGAPGQVIISQTAGVNWFCSDSAGGNLMTELRNIGGRVDEPPLLSQVLVTDGAWHRVGFVWDGSDRILYVDDIEVARDPQLGLGSSEGGLYIGAGKNLEPGSFFWGLIDDVRIYDQAVTP